MPIDPMIARGGVPVDVTNTLARGYALQQRNRALDQDQQVIDFRQQQEQNALLAQQDSEAQIDALVDELDRVHEEQGYEAAKPLALRLSRLAPELAQMWDAYNAPKPEPKRDIRQLGSTLLEVPAEGAPQVLYRAPQQVPQQAPARPQLVDVTLPDGRTQKQWVMPGQAQGTPLGEPANPKADREAQKTEIQLSSTFANQSKDFNTVSGQYRRVLAVSRKPSPANDFALIYAFAKIQDPTSVVRESEFAQAAKTGAYGDQVAAAIGRIVNGKTLTEQQRYDFVNAARNAYEAQRQQWESSVVAPIKQQAEAYGLDWNNIYKDYTVKEESTPSPGPSKRRVVRFEDLP